MSGINQLLFRDWNSIGAGNTGRFIISNANASTQVWDISNPLMPFAMGGNLSGTEWEIL
jgi:hypothetical protein